MFHEIDYARVLQPQEDGYDVQVFQTIKNSKGYVAVDYPASILRFHRKVAVVPKNETDWNYVQQVNFNHISGREQTIVVNTMEKSLDIGVGGVLCHH